MISYQKPNVPESKNEQLVRSLVGWYIKQMGANSPLKSARFKGLPIRYNDVNLFYGKAPS